MNLTAKLINDAMLVTVNEARIDAAVAVHFKDKMRELTEDGPSRVVLDMAQVSFLDSSGLGAVVGAMKQMGPKRSLEIAGLSTTVTKVFKLTRMDSVFTIYPTAEDGIAPSAQAS